MEKLNETKSWYFEKNHNTDKPFNCLRKEGETERQNVYSAAVG